jgi:hypothetical protein
MGKHSTYARAHFKKRGKTWNNVKHGLRVDEKQYPDMVCAHCTCGQSIVATSRVSVSEKFYEHIKNYSLKNKYQKGLDIFL